MHNVGPAKMAATCANLGLPSWWPDCIWLHARGTELDSEILEPALAHIVQSTWHGTTAMCACDALPPSVVALVLYQARQLANS